jgi:hypothetical protein
LYGQKALQKFKNADFSMVSEFFIDGSLCHYSCLKQGSRRGEGKNSRRLDSRCSLAIMMGRQLAFVPIERKRGYTMCAVLHVFIPNVAIPSAMKRVKSIMLINAVLQYSEKHQYRI